MSTIEIFGQVMTAVGLLMIIPALAFVVCFVRGVRAEIRERKERRHGPEYI